MMAAFYVYGNDAANTADKKAGLAIVRAGKFVCSAGLRRALKRMRPGGCPPRGASRPAAGRQPAVREFTLSSSVSYPRGSSTCCVDPGGGRCCHTGMAVSKIICRILRMSLVCVFCHEMSQCDQECCL